MPNLDEQQLKAQIKSGSFLNAYLIFGEEGYLKEYYVNKLRSKLVNPDFSDFNLHIHEEKNSTLEEILMDAALLPMMSEYSLVLVHDYPFKESDDLDRLQAYFKEPSESTVLIFWCDIVELDLKKNDKHKKLVNLFSKYAAAVELKKRSNYDIAKLVIAKAQKRGCSIGRAEADELIRIVGNDLNTVLNETEKICAYVQSGEITKKHINDLAVKSLQAYVFNLSNFIMNKNGDAAFKLLNDLFYQQEEPVSILAILNSSYVDVYRAKLAKQAGAQPEELKEYFNYRGKDFLISRAASRASSVSVTALRESMDLLSEADVKMKSTGIDGKLILEETVSKLLAVRS
ncbi:MAG: DNA polymerase III subunit delta [Eubacterium sp.]|nr:DNA polymerase III subunit delta [Eubacterium sp.]